MSELNDWRNNPDLIERRSEQLREDMSRTLQAIEQKLSPSQVMDRTLRSLKAGSSKTVAQLESQIQRHPLPAVLATMGVASVLSYRGRPRSHKPAVARSVSARASSARKSIGDYLGYASDVLDGWKGSGQSLLSAARHAPLRLGRSPTRQALDFVEQRPMVVGAVGLALAAAVGGTLLARRRRHRASEIPKLETEVSGHVLS